MPVQAKEMGYTPANVAPNWDVNVAVTIVVAAAVVPSTNDDVPPISGRTAMPVDVPLTVIDVKVHVAVQATAFEILNVFGVTAHAYKMVLLNVPAAVRLPQLTSVVGANVVPTP